MATSTATITVFPYPRGYDNTQRNQIVRGTIALSAGTYPAGGYSLTWSGIIGIQSIPIPASTPSSTSTPKPFDMDVKSTCNVTTNFGTGPSGFIYVWDSVNGNLHVFETDGTASAASGPLVEFGGPLPGSMVNDVIQFTAVFYRNN